MRIMDDTREISSIYTSTFLSYHIGSNGITEIKPYEENSDGALVVWYVWVTDLKEWRWFREDNGLKAGWK